MINNKKILIVAQYSAPYTGNFIQSLIELERELKLNGNKVVYIFPESAQNKGWIKDFKVKYKVYFVSDVILKYKFLYNRRLLNQLKDIVEQEKPDIIHTHFDGYDAPIAKVVRKKDIKVIWHEHNLKEFQKNRLKKLYQYIMFFYQYRLVGKKAYILLVSDNSREFIRQFGIKNNNMYTIPNGIDATRIQTTIGNKKKLANEPVRFLAYGGRGEHKGVDILIDAVKILSHKGYNYKLLITKGVDTEKYLNKEEDAVSKYIDLVDQVDDINVLLNQVDCFISASRRETFSYAVAENLFYGNYVILSDIEGTKWAQICPTTNVFRNEDAKSLADVIESFLRDFDKCADKDRLKSKKIIIDNFILPIWVDNIIKFYEQIQ